VDRDISASNLRHLIDRPGRLSFPPRRCTNTLLTGDHLIVDKLAYSPKGFLSKFLLPYKDRAARVTSSCSVIPINLQEDYVKRVIGVPGDHIKLVYVSGGCRASRRRSQGGNMTTSTKGTRGSSSGLNGPPRRGTVCDSCPRSRRFFATGIATTSPRVRPLDQMGIPFTDDGLVDGKEHAR